MAFATLALSSLTHACDTLVGAGKAPVAVAGETAVIVWDPSTRTEHFIRTATFAGTDGPMAFLVPTPTPPRLKALDEGYLDTFAIPALNAQVASRIEVRKRRVYRLSRDWSFDPFYAKAASKSLRQLGTAEALYFADDKDDVQVLSQAKVGGYGTAVLRADNPKALLLWLRARGFASDARLEDWLRPYTDKGWAITAFRFRPQGRSYTSEPVCLSFRTDRPFYPYREPTATNAPASRSLRVFLVAPERREGRLENGAWPTAAEYAGPLPDRRMGELTGGLDLPDAALRGRWLTSFLDKRAVRPDSELHFDPSPDKGMVEPPPVVRWEDDPVDVPKGLVAATGGGSLALVGFLLVRRRRRPL